MNVVHCVHFISLGSSSSSLPSPIFPSLPILSAFHPLLPPYRRAVLLKVCQLAENWVVEVSQRKGKTEEEARVLGCKVFTFGSYRLGVHGQGEGRGHLGGGWGRDMCACV